jgi:hypothetical protein
LVNETLKFFIALFPRLVHVFVEICKHFSSPHPSINRRRQEKIAHK